VSIRGFCCRGFCCSGSRLFLLSRSHPTPDSYSSLTRLFHLSHDSSSLFCTCSFLISPSYSPPQLLSHRFRRHLKQQPANINNLHYSILFVFPLFSFHSTKPVVGRKQCLMQMVDIDSMYQSIQIT
jgi:hypothetical protein